ncbi:rod shape-determining protein [Vibrio sp. WXL210]|uniref:rod shape-determining protein n=1 Tax=Vibrio sp. WXL210 TaxID=3450709 RepID=UPI003EC91E3F
MFRFIKGLFSHDLLIELSEKEIVIKQLGKDKVLRFEPYIAVETCAQKSAVKAIGSQAKLQTGADIKVINPFTHPRSFVADFFVAEKLIHHGVREMHQSWRFAPTPRIIMHQLDKVEGGLTQIEERVLRELAIGGGARDVAVHVGAKLNSNTLTFDQFKQDSCQSC